MTAPGSPPRDGVDAVIAAAVATADRDLAGASRPAFAGVVARAHRQDPAQIPRAWLTHPLDADADPRRARPTAARDRYAATDADPRRLTAPTDLDAETDADPRRRARPTAARDRDAATDADPRRLTAPTDLDAATDAEPRRRARPTDLDADPRRRARPTAARDADDPRRHTWVIFTLTAAAIVLLAFGVQRAIGRHEAPGAFQAGAQPAPPPSTSPERPRPPPARTDPELAPIDPPATRDPELTAPAPIDPPATRDPAAAVEPAARPREPREPLDDLLARLDDEAEACMQAGDYAGADERYRQIVARGGRRVQVELAFSDRFHLARRRDDEPALRKLWTAYLDRFPRGQFADDARGGLCRLAPAATRAACWRDYLADFPSGSFAADARAAGDAP
ncbi:MAG: hypothetical protein JNL82_27725 [Myxococcales bacterium]|nr:hypothetical protein [Myxococcales bacterium]